MKKSMLSLLTLALSTGVVTHALEARAHDAHRIVGDFANYDGLLTVEAQARTTFAVWSTFGSGPGGVTACPTVGDQANCWVYWQPEPWPDTVYAGLRVEPYVNSHYHLSFEDPSLTCFVDPGDGGGTGFGRPAAGGTCVAPNYAMEPRTVMAHSFGEWYWVWTEAWQNSTGSQGWRYFDLESFRNSGSDPVDLWVLWNDGQWYVLEDLPPGVHDVSGWAYEISDALIGSDTAYSAIDDVIVNHILL